MAVCADTVFVDASVCNAVSVKVVRKQKAAPADEF